MKIEEQLEIYRAALEQIAHGHDWQAMVTRVDSHFAIGAAQGIARRALGEPQNEWTEEPMSIVEECERRGRVYDSILIPAREIESDD